MPLECGAWGCCGTSSRRLLHWPNACNDGPPPPPQESTSSSWSASRWTAAATGAGRAASPGTRSCASATGSTLASAPSGAARRLSLTPRCPGRTCLCSCPRVRRAGSLAGGVVGQGAAGLSLRPPHGLRALAPAQSSKVEHISVQLRLAARARPPPPPPMLAPPSPQAAARACATSCLPSWAAASPSSSRRWCH
jgi:hypothetical protein